MSDQTYVLIPARFDGGNLTGFLKSINADITPDQLLTGSFQIAINNLGGGNHQIRVIPLWATTGPDGLIPPQFIPLPIPDNTETLFAEFPLIDTPGLYIVTANVSIEPIAAPVTVRWRITLDGGVICEDTRYVVPTAGIIAHSVSMISYAINLPGAGDIKLTVFQDSGGPLTLAGCTLNIIRIGD